MAASDESSLWTKARGGDREAFAALFDRHAPALFRFAVRLLGPGADAEDAVQTVLLSVLERGGYDPSRGSLRTYLFGAVRNQARKLRRAQTEDTPEELRSAEPAPDEQAAREQAGHAVSTAIAALPWVQREVLLLAHYEDLSLKEIAEALEIEVAAVKSRLHRARESLRARLEPYAASKEGDRR